MQKANKNDVRKEIADLINRIKEQSDRIGKERDIPQRELDLILYRIEELHKKTVVWAYLNELPAEVLSSQFSVLGSEQKVSGSQFPVSGSDTIVPVTENAKPVEQQKVAVPEKKSEPIVETPKVVEPHKEETQPKTENPVPSTTGNRKPETGNLKDVRTFIGINEKIMYIRQVFKGDDIAYNTAIEKFNNMNTWSEAQSYLSALAEQYKWGKHDEPSEIFTQTVKRRFS